MKKFVLLAAATLSFVARAEAQSLIVNGSGQLTGATGVNVGGSVYDVTFADGTCASLFSGCDAISDLQFQTLSDSQLAVQALLDQVLIDGPDGQFDSDYTLTFGCATNVTEACRVTIPYSLAGLGQTNQALNTNTADITNLAILGGPNTSFANEPGLVWAVFTPSAAPVPEPATWAMMLFGFGSIGVVMRRRRRSASLTQLV